MKLRARTSLIAVTLLTAVASATSGQAIDEDRKILALDGAAGDALGSSIALAQGIIAVGAPGDDDNGANSGSVYLLNASTGAQIAKLLPTDGAAGDSFGFSVAFDGAVVAVGAPGDDDNGAASGSAYLFDASTGAQLGKLLAVDGGAGDEFGYSIAIDNGVVAVGSIRDDDLADDSGSAYLFDASTGSQLIKLLPDDDGNRSFGISMAMDGGVVAIGARMHFDLDQGFTLDAVYLFDASSGDQLHKLMANNGTWTDFFGTAVDIDNGLVAVGAWARSIFFDHSGAAYVFDVSTGEQLHYFYPADGHDRDHFGNSISIDDGIVAVGAHQDGDRGWVAGSAYLFDALDGTQIDKLLASDGAAFDDFGFSIAMNNGVVAVGAIGDQDNGDDAGSVYVYGAGAGLPGDLDGDGDVDQADLGILLASYGKDAGGDIDGDGDTDQADLGILLGNYGS